MSLETLLADEKLRAIAGARSYERGLEYFEASVVQGLASNDKQITAGVRGTRKYRIRLWAEKKALLYSCTCPMGADGIFCKHCVAVGLAWLASKTPQAAEKSRDHGEDPSEPTLEEVKAYLGGLSAAELVQLLMEYAKWDEQLREKLLLRMAKCNLHGADVASFCKAINRATSTRGFVDYYAAAEFTAGIFNVVDSIEDLLNSGQAEAVIELTEHALERAEAAAGEMDDSDGGMTSVLDRLQDLHFRACQKAKPEPVALARRLFDRELSSEYAFHHAIDTYAGILGKEGRAEYRRLATAEWNKIPALKPGQKHDYADRLRHAITGIMEQLAARDGDINEIVSIYARDLSSPYQFQKIAAACKKAEKHDLALEWAERGVRAFGGGFESLGLREFLADEYQRRHRHADALALAWSMFIENAGLHGYMSLKQHADRAAAWPEWRAKALAFMRQNIENRRRERRDHGDFGAPSDHSMLVEIFIWEKEHDTAWKEAQEGGCRGVLWLELAKSREKDHPQDAIAIYQRQVEQTLRATGQDVYRQAVGLMRRVHALMKQAGSVESSPDTWGKFEPGTRPSAI